MFAMSMLLRRAAPGRIRPLSLATLVVVALLGLIYVLIAKIGMLTLRPRKVRITSGEVYAKIDNYKCSSDDYDGGALKPCWRSNCPTTLRNRIFVSQNKAGFDDRLVVISRFANLAGYLCANLYVDPPHLLLHPKHNEGKPVSKDLTWADFYHFDFGFNQTLLEMPKDFVSASDVKDLAGRSPEFSITTTFSNGNWELFHLLENYVSQQVDNEESNRYFVWHIRSWIFKMDLYQKEDPLQQLPMPLSFPHLWIRSPANDCSCKYMDTQQLKPSEYINSIVQSVRNTIHDSQHVGVFHIRRGDSANWCNTSVATMKTYLECSFDDSTHLGNITVLLSTDERDLQYIEQILSVMDPLSFSHIRIIWLDPMIRNHIQKEFVDQDPRLKRLQNNYFVYAVTKEIRKYADFFMEQRRNINCPKCSPIAGLLGIP